MCGICGIYNFANGRSVQSDHVKKMMDTIVHRGPDDEGSYVKENLGLGFRRLSIIDLAGGHQPMSDTEQKIWVVFNGEIYNFPQLKKELQGYGHQFRTNSDTEVIVYGYKQWGKDFLNHLNGMFGLAVWDEEKKRLLVARDQMGIKLIYYKIKNGSLCFGSEIRPILGITENKPDIDSVALNLFLRYRYTPSPLTIYQDIKKLAPGTCLIVENNTINIERWWNYKPVPFDPMPSVKQAEEELLHLYKEAIERQLISDVPLGLLLSGGLDSGLLLALMNEYGKEWDTFTVGYGKGFKDDELSDAQETSDILKSKHHSVNLTREKFEDSLQNIIEYLEEPIASSSIVPMYFVSQKAREIVKVALVGQGPDELFGGYTRHLGTYYGNYWRSLPSGLRHISKAVASLVPRNEAIKRALFSLDVPERMKRYQQIFSLLPGGSIDELFQDDVFVQNSGDKILDCWNGLEDLLEETDELGGLQFLEIRSSLPDELLMYADKLSMAHSLEVRVPYLDSEVVKYVERLSASFKVRSGKRKWLHRRVCKNYLPQQIINRKKRGFAVNVVDDWFRDTMKGEISNALIDPASLMYKYLKQDKVSQLVNEHQQGSSDNHKIIFSLVMFEYWLRSQN